MIRLMKLELEQRQIRIYMIAAVIISALMIGLIYLLAYAPSLEPSDPDMLIFASYENVIKLYGVMSMAVFCTFGCVIYSRFVIEAYKGKQLLYLFSYPIDRKKMLFCKLAIVFLFILVAMILCQTVVFTIFIVTESFVPIIQENLSIALVSLVIKTTLLMVICATSLSVIATGVGFYTQSVPTTLITGIILSSLFCNIVFHSITSEAILLTVTIISLIAGAFVSLLMMNKVNKLEVM